MYGWDHIRHGRAVGGQEADKLCFSKIILFGPVSKAGNTENIFVFSVPADIHDPVPPAFMAGYRGEGKVFQCKKMLRLFSDTGQ